MVDKFKYNRKRLKEANYFTFIFDDGYKMFDISTTHK